MTRIRDTAQTPRDIPSRGILRRIQACFGELVGACAAEFDIFFGVRGRDDVALVSADEFRRLKGSGTGEALIAAMQASPYRDIDIELRPGKMAVRGVDV